MKKFSIGIILMFVLVSGVFAQAGQTIYYRHVLMVDSKTGVRRDVAINQGMYITFTRNSCYVSNEKGSQISNPHGSGTHACTYQGEQNNFHVFTYVEIGVQDLWRKTTTYTFSNDYKRLNIAIVITGTMSAFNNNTIYVYEQAAPPTMGPDIFY
ncbi:MAG: hypothetical protein FWD26_11390 [Treponema sp.]|nr:hypothetical protein [Treponema sp.]